MLNRLTPGMATSPIRYTASSKSDRLRRGVGLCFVLTILLLPQTSAKLLAQDTLGTDAETILPQIMPREVEILGEFEANFPSFQRPALTGFNPPPRIYEVPRDRMPYRGPYRQSSADLPDADLNAPVGPSIAIRAPGTPANGALSVTVGRLLSRDITLLITPPARRRTAFFASGTYAGWSNYKPFENLEPDLKTSAQSLTGETGIRTIQRVLSAGIGVSGFFDRYGLFGATPVGDPEDVRRVPLRSGVGVEANAWMRSATGSDLPFHLDVSYGASRFETEVFEDDRPDPTLRRAEKRLDASGSFGGRFSSATLALDGKISLAGLDSDRTLDRDYLAVDVGATLKSSLGRHTIVRLGARFLGYDVLMGTGAEGFESALYLSPAVEVDVFLRPGLQLYGRNRPSVMTLGLVDLHRINPYIINEPIHKPSVTTVDAELGAVWFAGPLRISAHGGLERHPHYGYFVRKGSIPVAGSIGGLFEPVFDDAAVSKAGAQIGLALPGGISTAVTADIRNGTMGNEKTVIPYFAELTGSVQVSASFADRRGVASLTARMEGPRYTDRTGSTQLDGFLDAAAEVSFLLSRRMGIVAQVDHLSERRFSLWEDYPQPIWLARGGIRFLW